MKTKLALILMFCSLNGFDIPAHAKPAQVVIIRHAEKSSDEDPDLSPRGSQRAQALVGFILTNAKINLFGPPVAIYATEPQSDGSVRAIKTVTPLAEKLQLTINHDFTKKNVSNMVDSILRNRSYDGRTVLISWVRNTIPEVADDFGAQAPSSWPSEIFDRAWILTFDKSGVIRFEDIPQRLLPGDSGE